MTSARQPWAEPVTTALRCVGAILLELPHLPTPGPTPWVATIRSAPHQPDQWARQIWRPVEQGWTIPSACVFGTIVEFGADHTAGRRRDRRTVRWYGIAVAHQHDWLILHGPHAHPTDAEYLARQWLAPARAYAVTIHDPMTDRTPEQSTHAHRPAVPQHDRHL